MAGPSPGNECSRRDLNPRHQLERLASLTGLDYGSGATIRKARIRFAHAIRTRRESLTGGKIARSEVFLDPEARSHDEKTV